MFGIMRLAAFMFVLQTARADLLPGSLVVNGDMETGSPSAWIKGGNIASTNLTWATDQVYSGSRSLKIVDVSTNAYGSWYQLMDLPPGSGDLSLKAKWFWKYDSVTNGNGFYFVVRFYQTNALLKTYTVPCSGSSGWVEKQRIWPVPDSADRIRLEVQTAGTQSETGTIWLDDVSAVITNLPVGLARIDAMPDLPSPYLMRDWKQVARDYDAFVFDFSKTGDYLPLIWWDTTKRNFDFNTFGMPTYVGHYGMTSGATHTANTCIPAVLGASLCGIDKSNQNGTNWVAMMEQYFNLKNGENLVLNGTSADTGRGFWFDTYPALLFSQLLALHPGTGGMEEEMQICADRYAEAAEAMGGAVLPWTVPDFNHTAFDFDTMTPVDDGAFEPDAAAGYAWIDYMAWVKWGDANHLNTALWAMDFLQQRPAGAAQNPFYEILLPYGVYIATRMNAELGTDYDIGKLLDWVFGPSEGCRPGFGVICDEPWGGYDCDGLVGSVVNRGGYAFAMNTFDTVGALVPMVRYDDRYALHIAKWVLNAANASRLFYSGYLPSSNQTCLSWADAYDPDSCLPYEGLAKDDYNASPVAMGDPLIEGYAATDFALYGGGHVGLMAACIETSNVPGILQLNLLATDFYRAAAYPTYLYFNPYSTGKVVQINTGTNAVDIYDAVANEFLHFNVSGTVALGMDAKSAVMPVLIPAGAEIRVEGSKMLANGVVADYQVPVEQAGNFWPNPSFESGSGQPDSYSKSGTDQSIAVWGTSAEAGSRSLALIDNSSTTYGSWVSSLVTLPQAALDKGEVRLKWYERYNISGTMRLSVTFYDASNAAIVSGTRHILCSGQSERWADGLFDGRMAYLSIPVNAVKMMVHLVSGGGDSSTGSCFIDELTVSADYAGYFTQQNNFWVNTSFESGSGTAPTNYVRISDTNITVWAVSPVHSGERSLALLDSSTNTYGSWLSDLIALPGTAVSNGVVTIRRFEGYDVTDGTMRLSVTFRDASNTVISSATVHFICSGASAGYASGELHLRTDQVTVPSNAVKMRMELVSGGSASATGEMAVDDLSVSTP